jgi:glycosyltransferase involved in cell wall biosynthesis
MERRMKMKSKSKLLWYSNSPTANSGYSKQTRFIVHGLMQNGYQTDLSVNYGFGAGTMYLYGSKVWPMGTGRSETEAIEAYSKGKYDMLITLYDVWVLHALVDQAKRGGVVWVPYIPLDFLYLPHDLGNMLQAATHILPMTQYGLDMLKRVGFQNVDRYIHHGVDTKVYRVIENRPKQEMRDMLGFRDKSFILSIFKMNKGDRAKYGENLEAIKIFITNNPDLANEVGIYIHALPNTPGGQPLQAVIKSLGLENYVRYVKPYDYICGFTEEQMSQAYNGSDCVLNNVSSGGFEINIIESLASGTPVIATDGMSMHELLKPVLPELLAPAKTEYWTPLASKVMQPDPEVIAEKIEWVVNHDMNKRKERERLARHAKRMWSWDAIIPKWVQYIQFLEEFVDQKCIHVPALPSAYMRKLSRQGVTI